MRKWPYSALQCLESGCIGFCIPSDLEIPLGPQEVPRSSGNLLVVGHVLPNTSLPSAVYGYITQHITHYTYLQCNAIHPTAEKQRKEIYIWTNFQHHPLCLHSVELKFLCSALPIDIFAFVIIICGPLWLTYLLHQVFDVLKHNGNISRLALYISLWIILAIYRKF